MAAPIFKKNEPECLPVAKDIYMDRLFSLLIRKQITLDEIAKAINKTLHD